MRRTTRSGARGGALGFTLIELMVTLSVAAILAMFAVPSFRHVLVSTHLADLNNDLVHDLQYARTEAVSRQVDVAVAASSGNWQNGWTVEAAPASTAATATWTVLRQHPAVQTQYSITAPAASVDVTYIPQGRLATGAAGTCFTIFKSDGENDPPRFLQVWQSGMVTQSSPDKPSAGPACEDPAP